MEDDSLKSINGHEAPILSLAIDPQSKYLASSSCDGTVKIWDIETLECVKTIDNHKKSNDLPNSETICRICWSNKGNVLFVPSKSGINVYHRESWSLKACIVQQGFEDVVTCDISHDDKFLAAGSKKGSIVVWSYQDTNQSLLSSFATEKSTSISCLRWNPRDSKKLVATDESGYYHFLVVGESGPEAQKPDDYDILLNDFDLDDDIFADEEGVDETPKEDNVPSTSSKLSPDDPPSIPPSNSPSDEMNLDDENEFDIGKLKAEYEPKIFGQEDQKESNTAVPYIPASQDPEVAKAIKKMNDLTLPLLQPPFQPGSSPINFEERYMKWNSVGIITSRTEDNENSIHIEFHDTTTSHSRHFVNSELFTIADLSVDAIAFANSDTEESSSSRIFCILLNGMGDSREWHTYLPRDEYVEALALGDGFLSVATDKRNIRVFTTAGMQLFIFSIPGPVVCLAAQEQSLMIIYHSGSGLPGEQSLHMMIVKIDAKNLIGKRHHLSQAVQVSLSPLSSLSWAGFSDEGTPCIVDSEGVVRLYKDFIGNFWTPILDFTTKVSFYVTLLGLALYTTNYL